MANGAAIATLGAILKDLYLPPVQEQLNNEILLIQRLENRAQELVGNQAVVPLHTNRSGGIGSRAENAALPAAGSQGYAKAVYDLKYHYGRVRVTGVAMVKTANTAGAFLKALQGELDGIRQDLQLDVARQLYGNGDSVVATCGASGPSTTVLLSSDEPLRKGYLYIGMVVDIGTMAAPTSITAAANITDFSISAKTITIDASVTVTGANFVFRSGNALASSVSNEMTGLNQIVATAANSVGGINAASAGNSYWDNQRTNQAGALTLDALTKAFNSVQVAGGNPSLVLGSPGAQRALFNLLQPQVRYVEPMNLKGGFKAIEYMGQPFVSDRLAPFGKVYILDERFVKVFSPGDWHFLDEDGNTLKWVVGFDAWEAVLARYINMGTSRRNTNHVIYGLTDDPAGI